MSAPVTFFGRDLKGSSGYATVHPLADAAQASLFSHLSGIGTETFDGFQVGTTPSSVTFGSAGTAMLTSTANPVNGDSGGEIQSGRGSGVFPISGNAYNTDSTTTLTFATPTAAFGFYATDEGDGTAPETFSLSLTDVNGIVSTLLISSEHSSVNDGSALYFGFYDTADTYKSISIVGPNSQDGGAGADVVDLDNLSIGSIPSSSPPSSTVPEPESLTLIGLGLVAAGAARRRRR